ncbi:MAG TPA: universal stress protein [Candidatus Limnocylindria bacterium]|nr:universal stress protein [Candidatus Limnocylindria bacterium]
MFEQIFACLDGSAAAEKILPLAQVITAPQSGKLTVLRVVQDSGELAAEEEYWRDRAKQYRAELRFLISADPPAAIGAELERDPRAIAALTTHGRSAWAEAVLGSVTLRVIRESKRPVIVFRAPEGEGDIPKKLTTVAVALDGSDFAEKILRYAVKAAAALSARLLLLQVLPILPSLPPSESGQRFDAHESSYLHRKAEQVNATYGIEPQWEVLHGEPADAIRRYLSDMPETLLALTTHARGGVERVVLGSVAGACVRHAGVPLLLYWPAQ